MNFKMLQIITKTLKKKFCNINKNYKKCKMKSNKNKQ